MQNINIKNKTPVCENFWGQSAVYHCYAEMPDEEGRNYTPQLAQIEADRVIKMGVKVVRTFYKWWAWDAEKQEWNWENAECKALYRWLQRLKQGGVAVALNACWCCSGDVNGVGGFNGCPPWADRENWEKSVQGYADFISETVHQLIEVRGFTNIKILTLFTEPQNGRPAPGKPPITRENWLSMYETYYDCVVAADAALRRDNRRDKVLLMGPNEGSTATSLMVKWMAENLPEGVLDIYSSHNYQWLQEIEEEPENNGWTVATATPGGRIYQLATLKPNTEYEVKMTCRVLCNDLLHLSGSVAFGAFSGTEAPQAGGQPTTRLNQASVKLVEAGEFSAQNRTFSMKFCSGNATSANITVFCDLKAVPFTFKLEKLELICCESGKSLLKNSIFADGADGYNFVCMDYTCSDAALLWMRWAQTGLNYVPKGKPYFFDEFNIGFNKDHSWENHGAYLVNGAVALMNTGVATPILWTLFDQQWPNSHTTNPDCFVDGDHRWGLAPLLTRSLVPYKSYYAYALLSRFTGGPGSKVYAGVGANGLHAVLNVMADGNATVVVVNCRSQKKDFTLQFEQPVNYTFHRHCFNPKTVEPNEKADLILADKTLDPVTETLSDSIAPYSVTVYTTLK